MVFCGMSPRDDGEVEQLFPWHAWRPTSLGFLSDLSGCAWPFRLSGLACKRLSLTITMRSPAIRPTFSDGPPGITLFTCIVSSWMVNWYLYRWSCLQVRSLPLPASVRGCRWSGVEFRQYLRHGLLYQIGHVDGIHILVINNTQQGIQLVGRAIDDSQFITGKMPGINVPIRIPATTLIAMMSGIKREVFLYSWCLFTIRLFTIYLFGCACNFQLSIFNFSLSIEINTTSMPARFKVRYHLPGGISRVDYPFDACLIISLEHSMQGRQWRTWWHRYCCCLNGLFW